MKTKGTPKKCRIRNGLNVQHLSFLREKWEKTSMDEIELTIAMDCVERAKTYMEDSCAKVLRV